MDLLDQPIGNIASDISGATHILDRYKFDYCGHGERSLRDVYGYRESWGLPGRAIADELVRLMTEDATGGD